MEEKLNKLSVKVELLRKIISVLVVIIMILLVVILSITIYKNNNGKSNSNILKLKQQYRLNAATDIEYSGDTYRLTNKDDTINIEFSIDTNKYGDISTDLPENYIYNVYNESIKTKLTTVNKNEIEYTAVGDELAYRYDAKEILYMIRDSSIIHGDTKDVIYYNKNKNLFIDVSNNTISIITIASVNAKFKDYKEMLNNI